MEILLGFSKFLLAWHIIYQPLASWQVLTSITEGLQLLNVWIFIAIISDIQTKAEKKGGDYIINGSKMWITNAFQADWMCLLANTSSGPSHQNKSMIVLPMDTPGEHQRVKIHPFVTYKTMSDNIRISWTAIFKTVSCLVTVTLHLLYYYLQLFIYLLIF